MRERAAKWRHPGSVAANGFEIGEQGIFVGVSQSETQRGSHRYPKGS